MKQIMKKLSLGLLAMGVLTPAALLAQQEGNETKAKKEGEQIIITRKGNSDGKLVIEVNGDKVTVNGKEYDKNSDGDVTVLRNKIKDVWAYGGSGAHVYNGNGTSQMYKLMNGYEENRAMLGVTTEKADQGVEVIEITKESAAEKAGVKKGDIITSINDKKVTDPDALSKIIREYKPGDKVTVNYIRDKKAQKVTTELTKWKGVNVYTSPENFDFKLNFDDLKFDQFTPRINPAVPDLPQLRSLDRSWSTSGSAPKLGVSVQDTEDGKGVNVLAVDGEGNGAKAGLKEGDVITEVDGKAVNSADEMARVMRENKDKASVKMKIQRKGKTETLDVKIPRKLKTANL